MHLQLFMSGLYGPCGKISDLALKIKFTSLIGIFASPRFHIIFAQFESQPYCCYFLSLSSKVGLRNKDRHFFSPYMIPQLQKAQQTNKQKTDYRSS